VPVGCKQHFQKAGPYKWNYPALLLSPGRTIEQSRGHRGLFQTGKGGQPAAAEAGSPHGLASHEARTTCWQQLAQTVSPWARGKGKGKLSPGLLFCWMECHHPRQQQLWDL